MRSHRGAEADDAGSVPLSKATGEDRDEDDVVNAEHDLEHGQRHKAVHAWIGEQFANAVSCQSQCSVRACAPRRRTDTGKRYVHRRFDAKGDLAAGRCARWACGITIAARRFRRYAARLSRRTGWDARQLERTIP